MCKFCLTSRQLKTSHGRLQGIFRMFCFLLLQEGFLCLHNALFDAHFLFQSFFYGFRHKSGCHIPISMSPQTVTQDKILTIRADKNVQKIFVGFSLPGTCQHAIGNIEFFRCYLLPYLQKIMKKLYFFIFSTYLFHIFRTFKC